MIVVFRRTGQRRYAIEAQRPGFPPVVMNPAPGYDQFLPHDMMHLVVEAQLGLTLGVFGQLAQGGDAGTFHLPLQQDKSARETARARTRIKARGVKLLKEGRDESARSERATYICWYEWLARAVDERSGWIAYLRVDPRLDALHGDARYDRLFAERRAS